MKGEKVNILILEDKEDPIRLLENNLVGKSLVLHFVSSEKELVKKLNDEIDLIIIDLRVPKHIYGVSEIIREDYFRRIHKLAPNIDIIIFTGLSYEHSHGSEVKDLWKIGPYFCLYKDSSSIELISLVVEFCLKSNDNNNYTSTSHEKGKVLEDLMAWIFNNIDGFSLEKRVLTKMGEIDIMILNEIMHSPFWLHKGDNIPVECRNKKKKGKEGIRSNNDLKTKLQELKECKLGFFVSAQGFSPKFLEALALGDKYIVPIDEYRIKELVQSRKPVILLKEYIIEVAQQRDSLKELIKRNR